MSDNRQSEDAVGESGRPDAAEPACPVMLALSTFRRSDRAVELAIELAQECGKLHVVYVADRNLARYLIGTDVEAYPELRHRVEEEILRGHEEQGRQHVESIAQQARAQGVDVDSRVSTGRFALVCLDAIKELGPRMVVTTRSKRSRWVKRFFGSPVTYLVEHAGCPVIEA